MLNNITITVYNKQTAETQAAKMLNISVINSTIHKYFKRVKENHHCNTLMLFTVHYPGCRMSPFMRQC